MTLVRPGATIGILGGGQLGRMTGMAARSLGYDVHVLDPDPNCPARAVASRVITASFSDAGGAAELARGCDVVTLEIEQISRVALEAAAQHAPLHPGVEPVYIIQDRIRQRTWLDAHAFPVGAYRVATSAAECEEAVAALGPSICKAPMGGYDGRGQVRVASAGQGRAAYDALGGDRCIVEQFLPLELELSVLVARRADGACAVYPPSLNHHTEGVLDWSACPAPVSPELARRASDVGRGVAEALGLVGLVACELFVTTDGRLLINELAPRPHNSYHHTERGCSTSQFEQLVRAVCGLPLGVTDVTAPSAIANLLGDLWSPDAPSFDAALTVPHVRLHLYGKTLARPGRKMGHLSAVGASAMAARDAVLSARSKMIAR